jgi:hypothetical protein
MRFARTLAVTLLPFVTILNFLEVSSYSPAFSSLSHVFRGKGASFYDNIRDRRQVGVKRNSRPLSMQLRTPSDQAAAFATSAAIAVSAVNAAVSMRALEAPEVTKTYIVQDTARQGSVDESGLPIVYDKDLIGEHFKSTINYLYCILFIRDDRRGLLRIFALFWFHFCTAAWHSLPVSKAK